MQYIFDMKNKLFVMILSIIAIFAASSCKKVGAEDLGLNDASADALIMPSFSFMILTTGNKMGERISGDNFKHIRFLSATDFESWNPQNGDVFFFRGDLVSNYFYNLGIDNPYFAIVPLETDFYWNGVGLYYDGFLYRITATENGPRIYNQGLWTIGGHCLIVHASSSLALPENSLNDDMMKKIHKVKVKRGHLKADKMDKNKDHSFTPPGLVDKFYANQGKKIRPDDAGEYVRAEDFIEKTDADNGYFQSRTDD